MPGAMLHTTRNKVVILDLGNVVLDWDVDRILNSLDLAAEEKNLLREQLFCHQHWLDLDHGRETETAVVSQVCQRTPLSRDTVEIALGAARESLAPIEESVMLMREIANSGIEMHCLSNMSRETWAHIRQHELFDLFDGIVISAIEGCMKPDAEIFQLTIERFDLQPSNTLFVDDSLPNIDTARRLGLDGFHFKRSRGCYSEIRKRLFQDTGKKA